MKAPAGAKELEWIKISIPDSILAIDLLEVLHRISLVVTVNGLTICQQSLMGMHARDEEGMRVFTCFLRYKIAEGQDIIAELENRSGLPPMVAKGPITFHAAMSIKGEIEREAIDLTPGPRPANTEEKA